MQVLLDCDLGALSLLLKVHKNENFFGFDFEFCTISLLVMQKNKILGKFFFDFTIMEGA